MKVDCADRETLTVGIRPEGFVLQEDGPLCCALQAVEVMGRDHSVVSAHPAARSTPIRSIIPSEETPQVKSGSVRFRLKPFKMHLFDSGTGERIPFTAV
jgi:multiple sugar transport system ATP-binding protein